MQNNKNKLGKLEKKKKIHLFFSPRCNFCCWSCGNTRRGGSREGITSDLPSEKHRLYKNSLLPWVFFYFCKWIFEVSVNYEKQKRVFLIKIFFEVETDSFFSKDFDKQTFGIKSFRK